VGRVYYSARKSGRKTRKTTNKMIFSSCYPVACANRQCTSAMHGKRILAHLSASPLHVTPHPVLLQCHKAHPSSQRYLSNAKLLSLPPPITQPARPDPLLSGSSWEGLGGWGGEGEGREEEHVSTRFPAATLEELIRAN